MASSEENILEQSTTESSTEFTSNPGSIANGQVIAGFSTELLDPPTDESLTESGNNSSTRLLTLSHPQYSSTGVTVLPDTQSVEPLESEATAVDESFSNRCRTYWNWYKNKAMDYRKSCYIYIVHLLFSYIPISAIIFGLVFANECPQSPFLHIVVTAVGVVGVVFMIFGVAVCCCEYHCTPCSRLQKLALEVLFVILVFLVVIEMCFVGRLSPNFDPTHEDYCHETLYHYLIDKETVSAAAIILGVLIYFPGSSLHTFCRC